MRLDAIASERHYADHLLPVWRALEGDITEGHLTLPGAAPGSVQWGATPVLVASSKDARTATRKGHPVILMEHGADQSYIGVDHPSYNGASDRNGVILYLAPNEGAAEVHRAAHPTIPVAVVGCPKLDALIDVPRPTEPCVAITHHWNTGIVPETRPAFPHFCSAYPGLAERFPTIAHAHPRAAAAQSVWFKRHRFTWVPSFPDVVAQATVLVVDNSSAGMEWMALDRPVVWLNPPWYRRDVHHGGRFWERAAGGIQIDHPDQLESAVAASIACDPLSGERRRIVPSIYANLGTATQAAADAIRSRLNA